MKESDKIDLLLRGHARGLPMHRIYRILLRNSSRSISIFFLGGGGMLGMAA